MSRQSSPLFYGGSGRQGTSFEESDQTRGSNRIAHLAPPTFQSRAIRTLSTGSHDDRDDIVESPMDTSDFLPQAPAARGRGRGRARQPAQVLSISLGSDERPPPPKSKRGRKQADCPAGLQHPPDLPQTTCPYEVTRRQPETSLPDFYNLSTGSIDRNEYSTANYNALLLRSIQPLAHLGYELDFTQISQQPTEVLENIVIVIHRTMTIDCRSMDPMRFLHELYDIWCQTFSIMSVDDEPMSASLPKDPRQVIIRCLACVDCFKIIYTELAKQYKLTRQLSNPEKLLTLSKCQELVKRMHVLARGFACLCQCTTLGFDNNMSVERVAHDYSLRLPFLVGIELPIDFNVPGRDPYGSFDPLHEPYQYFMRWLLQVIGHYRLRLHGEMLYTQHMIADPREPTNLIPTRYWKPLQDIRKFIYQVVSPVGQEHVFRAVISTRQTGINQIAEQLINSGFVPDIKPDFRYRSFRNGLYQMEVDMHKEPDLLWNDPARLSGRFLPYSSPLCPSDVATETFYNTDFDPSWLQVPLVQVPTPCLDQLLSTQNIRIGSYLRVRDQVDDDGIVQRQDRDQTHEMTDEMIQGYSRIEFLNGLLGSSTAFDSMHEDWATDMTFVYLMALFLCGRCLRPLAYKVQTQTGEDFEYTDNYQCAPFFVGTPGTGKTTLLTVLSKMYHRTSTHELKCNSDQQFGLGQLEDDNIKFVYMTETAKQMPWGVSVLNGIVEGGMTEFRSIFKKPVTKLATFTMAFAANPDQVPADWIKDPRQGFRRRLAVFQFMVSPEKSDSEFLTRLLKEDELARMLVKFNRMYLIGRAMFDAVRLAKGSFNFMTYLTQHMYFSRVRNELFALASPADAFISSENDAMIKLDSTTNKCYLISDVAKCLKDFCNQRQVPPNRIPNKHVLMQTLQSNGCLIYDGLVTDEELPLVPKDVQARDKKNNGVRLVFVHGLIIMVPGFNGFVPKDTRRTQASGTSLQYDSQPQTRRGRKRVVADTVNSQLVDDLLSSLAADEMTRESE